MIIGFDFDKVFVNYPPLIPDSLVDFLYKGKFFKKTKRVEDLSYRFPGSIEQQIRILSHHHYFRRPINSNIQALRKISEKKDVQVYLVSSRFNFLKKTTKEIIDRYKIKKYFNKVYFNYENKQPHIFKEELIKKLKIEKYIDDDLDLALYLAKKIPELKVYWLNNKSKKSKMDLPNNVTRIKDLSEFIKNHL